MAENPDIEALIAGYRRLTPTQYTLLRERVTERAKDLRSEYLRSLFSHLLSWRRRRAAIAELNTLDDAMLKDIGLHRSGIEAAVESGSARLANAA